MTPDEIRALPAGRELDALVAEKVMGWQETPELDDELLPLYSTDIAAAWMVIEKICAAAGGFFTLSQVGSFREPEWWVEVRGLDAHSQSAPHAIVLAALLATIDLTDCEDMA